MKWFVSMVSPPHETLAVLVRLARLAAAVPQPGCPLPSLPLRSLDVVTSDLTFTQLRAVLGFGLVRLKLLLAIRRETCLDSPGWAGRFIAEIGPSGQVKAGIEQAKREVTLEEGT